MAKSLEFVKTKCMTGVRPNGKKIGLLAIGELKLDGVSYEAISGPWQKGVLPNETYTVKKYNVVASSDEAGYKSSTGKGWFIPLKQPANVKRSGFGIHPDGNVEGTAGCIGLVGDAADEFWSVWQKLSMKERPDAIVVSGVSEVGAEKRTIKGEGAKE